MIEDIFELFEFLGLFLQVINLSFIGIDGLIPVLDDKGLVFDLLFKLLIGEFEPLDFVLVLALLLGFVFLLLFFLLDFFLSNRHIALGSQRGFGDVLHLLRVLVFNLPQFFLFFFHDLPHCLLMLFLQSLNLSIDIILFLPRRLDLVLRVLCHFLQLRLIQHFWMSELRRSWMHYVQQWEHTVGREVFGQMK